MRLTLFLPVATAALLTVPAALASAPTDRVYGGAAGSVQKQVEGGGLPFTGFDVALLVIGSLALLVMGTLLRRAAQRTT